jgi:hypothetical protein
VALPPPLAGLAGEGSQAGENGRDLGIRQLQVAGRLASTTNRAITAASFGSSCGLSSARQRPYLSRIDQHSGSLAATRSRTRRRSIASIAGAIALGRSTSASIPAAFAPIENTLATGRT